MASQGRFEVVGTQVGAQIGALAFGPTVPRTNPNYTDTLDSGTVAGGGGDVLVSPADLDQYAASLQAYSDQVTAVLQAHRARLDGRAPMVLLGPQIEGVSKAVLTSARTAGHMVGALETLQRALAHDVAAVQAARQSYVGTDEDAAQDITLAGGAA